MAHLEGGAPRTEGGLLPTEAAKPRPTQFLDESTLTWGGRPPSETVGPPASLAIRLAPCHSFSQQVLVLSLIHISEPTRPY